MGKNWRKIGFPPSAFLMYGVERKLGICVPLDLELEKILPACERRSLWKLIVVLRTLPLNFLKKYTLAKITRALQKRFFWRNMRDKKEKRRLKQSY